jgi:segregation and condensation protein A
MQLLDAVQDDASFVVLTSVFDGPLDLLLHLVKRDGIDLERLEVAKVADAYLAWLDRMRALDLSVAGEWLVLAATLVHLKSLSLLPRLPAAKDGEPEIDPREAFAQQLRDHALARAGADLLDARPQVGREFTVRARQGEVGGPAPVAAEVDAFGLLEVLFQVLSRSAEPEPEIRFSDAHRTRPDPEVCCRRVLALAPNVGDTLPLVPVLGALPTRAERVVTFIGVLEMTRLGWIGVRQEEHLGPIEVVRLVADDGIDLSRVLGHATPPPAEPEEQIELPLVGRSA